MANTRNLPRDQRKYLKRRLRRASKALFASLTPKERTEWRHSEKTLKVFLKEKGRV